MTAMLSGSASPSERGISSLYPPIPQTKEEMPILAAHEPLPSLQSNPEPAWASSHRRREQTPPFPTQPLGPLTLKSHSLACTNPQTSLGGVPSAPVREKWMLVT